MAEKTVDLNLSAVADKPKPTKTPPKPKPVERPEGIGDNSYDLELPSDGRIYGKQVVVKSMTAKEEDILSNPQFLKKKTVFDELIKAILIKSPVDYKELLIGDRDFIVFNARIDAYGSEYEAKLPCPQCNALNEIKFDIGGMDITELKATPYVEGENLFEMTTSSGSHVLFHFWTVEMQNRFAAYVKQTTKLKTTGLVTTRLFFQLHSIDGIDDRAELRTSIEKMKSSESREIRKYINDHTPHVDLTIHDFDCVECGFDGEVDLPLGESFFWPDI
jgi:hypothetical protein